MISKKNTIAGIVAYNPEVSRLLLNIENIIHQVDKVIIIDNGSYNNYYSEIPKDIFIVKNNKNKGIAYALNQICDYAKINKYDWAVTLDQDSISPPNLIKEYSEYSTDITVGMFTPQIEDINAGALSNKQNLERYETIDTCITSASAIKIKAWEEVGNFCNAMFIDNVDFDMCLMLQKHNYKIVKCNRAILTHEIGNSHKINFMGKETLVFNHKPLRYYYIIRNTIFLGKKHKMMSNSILSILKRVIIVNLYEHDRFEKNNYMIRGIYHAIIGQYGEYK